MLIAAGVGCAWGAGKPEPLGPSLDGDAVNFALYAKYAKSVTLLLYTYENEFVGEVPLAQRTGDVWHVALAGLPKARVCYAYRVNGDGGWDTGLRWDPKRTLVDPYAPLISGRRVFGVRDDIEQFKGQVRPRCLQPQCAGTLARSLLEPLAGARRAVIIGGPGCRSQAGSLFTGTFDFESAPFDWGNDDQRKRLQLKDLVIYEMPVRSFTASPDSGLPEGMRGTFKGVAEKVRGARSWPRTGGPRQSGGPRGHSTVRVALCRRGTWRTWASTPWSCCRCLSTMSWSSAARATRATT